MGNKATASAKGALAVSNAKNMLGKTFSGESEGNSNHDPETRREMNKRHKQRELE